MFAILVVAAVPRFAPLGEESFWYDEVIPMRLALTPNPAALVRLLDEIEATRAPLHPWALQAWIRVFGRSEFAARSLSAFCGVMTVAVVFAIGRRFGGDGAGLWSAGLAAISPVLVTYSLEAKMYAWLTWLTCLAWWSLLRLRDGMTTRRMLVHALLLAALAYSQPLGLFMDATLALGALLDRPRSRLTFRAWLAIHLGAGALIVPWLPRYLDHPPEFLSDPPTLRLLLGMPIGFTGGNSRLMVVLVLAIGVGLAPFAIRGLTRGPRVSGVGPIVLWLVLPPLMLFGYSLMRHPLFGPSRYTVYVAPAYLILLGAGIARTAGLVQLSAGVMLVPILALTNLITGGDALMDGRKADWRAAARFLDARFPDAPVIAIPPTGGKNCEVEVARFYLPGRRVIPMPGPTVDDIAPVIGPEPGDVFFSASLKNHTPLGDVPAELNVDGRTIQHFDFRGLRLFRMRPRFVPPPDRVDPLR